MSKDKLPVVLARATSQPPKKPGASALVLIGRGLEALTRKFVDAKADFARRLAAIEDRPAPVDGVGIAGGIIDQEGNLVLTLTNGQPVIVGKVVGASPDAVAIAETVIRSLRDEVDALRDALVAAAPTAATVQSVVAEAVAGLPEPEPGKSVTVDDVRPLIAAEVAQAVDKLPPPAPMVDVGPAVAAAVAAELGDIRAAIEAIGQAPELPDIPALIADAVAALPVPEPGKSVTIDDVRPLIESLVAALPKPEPGTPGIGLASALIDRDGRLVVTLSDGSMKDLGPVVGASIDERAVATMVDAAVAETVAALPAPEPGKSVLIDDVRPVLAELVDAAIKTLPAPEKGKDADPVVTAALVRDEVAKATGDVPALVGAAVAEAVAALPPAEPGKSVSIDDVRPLILEAVATLPPPEPGKSVEPADVEALVARAVAALPPAEPGKSVTVDDVRPLVADLVAEAVAALPPPEPGKSIEPAEVEAMVAAAVAALPPPEPGKSVTLDEVRPLIAEAVAQIKIPDPVPGVGVTDMLITGEGRLAVILTNGNRVDAGRVVPDAEPGPPGRSVAAGEVNEEGHLILILSDDTKIDVGMVKGEPGDSVKGDPGRGVAEAKIVDKNLIFVFTDKTEAKLGRVVGENGVSPKPPKPPKPPKAIKGDPGPAGGLKVVETGTEYEASALGRLREITVETVDGEHVRLYARF